MRRGTSARDKDSSDSCPWCQSRTLDWFEEDRLVVTCRGCGESWEALRWPVRGATGDPPPEPPSDRVHRRTREQTR